MPSAQVSASSDRGRFCAWRARRPLLRRARRVQAGAVRPMSGIAGSAGQREVHGPHVARGWPVIAMRPGADPGPPPTAGRPSVTGPDGLNPPASAGRGTATAWLVTCWRGWRARASALARTTSGSRGSGGRVSRQERSRRALGLWIRICFTVISSAMSGPGRGRGPALFADRSRGRYDPPPPWGVTRTCASGWNLPQPAARHDSAAGPALSTAVPPGDRLRVPG